MAENFPDEGLDWLLARFPKVSTTVPATLYLGLFTSQTASTVPGDSAVLSTSTGITEAAYTNYARVAIASTDWGSVGDKTAWSQSGRGVTAAEVSFPAATAAYATAINGFFLATASSAGVCIFASNFSDTTAVASMAIGDIIKVTPTLAFLN